MHEWQWERELHRKHGHTKEVEGRRHDAYLSSNVSVYVVRLAITVNL